MRRSTSRLLIGLFAAPLMLVSSAALAAPGADACGNLELLATGSCEFVASGGCEAQCTPLNLVAACDGQCSASASASCDIDCSASCEAECTADPGGFDCEGSCTVDCGARCEASCTESDCKAQCQASCDNRCNIECHADAPSLDCKARCDASCGGSCKVEANIDCSVQCSLDLEGGCKVQCQEPKGALFCDGQYVNAGNIDDCLAYLATAGFTVDAGAHCDASGCEAGASVGCSAAPYVGAFDERFGVGAIAGLMMGVGMIVSRRRRRA